MQICSSCGKRVPLGLAECEHCGGKPIDFEVPEPAVAQMIRQPWFQGIGALLILVLGFLLIRQVAARRPESGAVTNSTLVAEASPQSSPAASVLVPAPSLSPDAGVPEQGTVGDPEFTGGMIPPLPFVAPDGTVGIQPAPSSSPGLGDSNDQPDTASMPNDVRQWLQHLASIEQERISLASSQVSGAAGIAGASGNSQDGGAQDFADASTVVRAAWSDLNDRFNSEPVPAECASIRSLYNTTLTGTRALVLDMMTAMRQAVQNPTRAVVVLNRIRSASYDRVDTPAESVDEAIDDLCARYDSDKWFKIDNQLGDRMVSQLGL